MATSPADRTKKKKKNRSISWSSGGRHFDRNRTLVPAHPVRRSSHPLRPHQRIAAMDYIISGPPTARFSASWAAERVCRARRCGLRVFIFMTRWYPRRRSGPGRRSSRPAARHSGPCSTIRPKLRTMVLALWARGSGRRSEASALLMIRNFTNRACSGSAIRALCWPAGGRERVESSRRILAGVHHLDIYNPSHVALDAPFYRFDDYLRTAVDVGAGGHTGGGPSFRCGRPSRWSIS